MHDGDEVVATIDVGATKTRWGLVALLEPAILAERVEPTVQEPRAVVQTLTAGIHALLEQAGRPVSQLTRVVVGVPGMVDKAGRVYNCFNLPSWEAVDLREVGAPFQREVRVIRDVTLATLGEWHTVAPSATDVVVLYLGSGIGTGLVVGGRLETGAHGGAGEVGHWTVVPEGTLCSCGKRGCLETVASGRSLERAAERLGYPGTEGVGRLFQGWRDGHPEASVVVEDLIRYLAIAVGNVWKLLDPAHIVLGGGVIDHAPDLVPRITAAARTYGASRNVEQAQISGSRFGRLAPLLGGVWVDA